MLNKTRETLLRRTDRLHYRMRLRFRIIISIAFAVLALIISYIAVQKRAINTLYEVRFDSNALLRVSDVTRVYKIKENPSDPNLIWFAADEGIRVLNEDLLKWQRYGMDHGLPSETVLDICFNNNIAWVATKKGVAFLDTINKKFIPINQTDGQKILAIESVNDCGVFYYSGNRGLFNCKVISGNTAISSLKMPDINGRMSVTCIKQIQGKLYVGFEGNGIFDYEPFSKKWHRYEFDKKLSKNTYFWDIMEHSGVLWIATSEDGVWSYDTLLKKFLLVDDFPCKGAFTFADEKDGLWCGTPWGLWRYYDKNKIWMQFIHPKEKNPTDFQVFSLLSSGDLLWYGSKELGAGYFNKVWVQWQRMRAGLSNPNVEAIARVGKYVYTGHGYRGDFIDRFYAQSMQYDINVNYNDGLREAYIQCLSSSNQRLYFGGYKSFGYFDFKTKRFGYFERN
ncbi:MAG: hypothetical protein AB1633_10250, partial [Elusimicrobiota bacterium]